MLEEPLETQLIKDNTAELQQGPKFLKPTEKPPKLGEFSTLEKKALLDDRVIIPPTRAGEKGSLNALVKAETKIFCLICG